MWIRKNLYFKKLSRHRYVLLMLICGLVTLSLYFFPKKRDYNTIQYVSYRHRNSSNELVNGYLVWNEKCHILSKNPFDPSIRDFIWKEKIQNCSTLPPLTKITKDSNENIYLIIDDDVKKYYSSLSCCWTSITRPTRTDTFDTEFDSKFDIGDCLNFQNKVEIPIEIDVVHVKCNSESSILQQINSDAVYENVHAIIHSRKVQNRLAAQNTELKKGKTTENKKLSVLMLGIDSISRLNFQRSMPLTRNYLDENDWFELKGYNKIGDNTFPNIMAFLTGQSEKETFLKCKPDVPYGLDNCSIIWNDFQDAGYATAYGEDNFFLNTFNYLKVGFVNPPTDYYLRPYAFAYENLLKSKYRFYAKYCAGPELAFDRIFDFGIDFAKTFLNKPYFGLLWSSTVSHENVNGPSAIDAKVLVKLRDMEKSGVTNDSMIVLLSDHGMRYGNIRDSFIGWYEERLPFIYIWLPRWFREQNPEAVSSLRINRNRLTSPFDLYETLRDVVNRAGGQAMPSSACPKCKSLFRPVDRVRGCSDAGITSHWCTCDAFQLASTTDAIVVEGANKFIDYIENIVKEYKNEEGIRLCATPKLKKINKVQQIVDLDKNPDGSVVELFYSLEVMPGDAKFEVTITYSGQGNYSIRDEEISRINSYAESAKCLNKGNKKYCHCS